ncbi:hypothetical protein [Intestinibacter sp.]|uniref:hypothetical protein n=1 Tax=Intestinibacter sp. TaxID=1965304 RepID=UPI003F15634B
MRFSLEFKDYKMKNVKNINLRLLNTFLNEYTIDTYCSDIFKMIIIKFLNNFPSKRTEKQRTLYSDFVLVEIKSDFKNKQEINILEFQEAFNKIIKAVKKINIENKDFNLNLLMESLKVAEKNIPNSNQELEEYNKNKELVDCKNLLRLADYNIKMYKQQKREFNRPLKGIRIYSDLEDENVNLQPYIFMYENIFTNLLKRENIMLPGYNEIYIYIDKTLNDAKVNAFGYGADWSKMTYGEIDIDKYISSTESEKSEIVFSSIYQGLRMIADFDHLNSDSIERAINTVKVEGFDIDLVYIEKENKNYEVKVVYNVPRVVNQKALFKLCIKDKNSKKEGCVNIDYFDLWYVPYSISQIKIRKTEILIEGRKSLRAEISRKHDNLPDKYLFVIDKILL